MKKLIFIFITLVLVTGCDHSEKKEKSKTKEEKSKTSKSKNVPESSIDWNYADSLKNEILLPGIPADTFYVQVSADKENSVLIQQTIDKAFEKGGGTVVIPKGVFFSGPIVLKSKINLHLKNGAELRFIAEPEKYPLVYTWFLGIPCMNYSPMIYAKNSSDIKISGEGTINGQGNNQAWKNMKFREEVDWELLKDLEDEKVEPANRKFGKGHSLRPDLIEFVECSKIEISGVSIINSPLSAIQPVLCENINITGIKIGSSGFDNVGISIESSEKIFIDRLEVDSVNEGIKIRSGKVKIPGNRASSNILIQNSKFKNIVNSAITVSSFTKGGANRIFISGLDILVSKTAFRIHADASLKAALNDIFVKKCTVKNISESVLMVKVYNSEKSLEKPLLSNVYFDELVADSCGRAFIIAGHEKNRVQNLHLSNAEFSSFKGSFAEDVKNLVLANVNENGKLWDGTWNIDDNNFEEIKLESSDEEKVLDTDDIDFNDLPEIVVNQLHEIYPFIPVNDIERKITKSNVLYEIELENEKEQDLKMVIQNDGNVIRSEKEIYFHEIPLSVVSSLESYLKTKPVEFMMNQIKKIVFQDLTYYQIECETGNTLFAVGITENGNIIEAKQKLIASYFPPKK